MPPLGGLHIHAFGALPGRVAMSAAMVPLCPGTPHPRVTLPPPQEVVGAWGRPKPIKGRLGMVSWQGRLKFVKTKVEQRACVTKSFR
jgi:hypothetical protein